jgi:hypothetical protein
MAPSLEVGLLKLQLSANWFALPLHQMGSEQQVVLQLSLKRTSLQSHTIV